MPQSNRELFQLRGSTIDEVKRELNSYLQRLARQLDDLQGLIAATKHFGDLDLGGKRITHLGDPSGDDDAQKKTLALSRPSPRDAWDAKRQKISEVLAGTETTDAVNVRQLTEALAAGVIISAATPVQIDAADAGASGAGPAVSASTHEHPVSTAVAGNISSVGSVAAPGIGTTIPRGDHVHPGVDLSTAQTVGGAKTWSDKGTFSGEVEIDGDLNHDGTNVGVMGATPVPRPAAYTQTYSTATRTHSNPTGVDFTDNSGGTASDTIAAITGGGLMCEDATKNAIASLARQSDRLVVDMANVKQVVNQILDDVQAFGFFG